MYRFPANSLATMEPVDVPDTFRALAEKADKAEFDIYCEDVFDGAENIIANAFPDWEMILCTSASLDLVWAQVLSDPFLRRLILRFILCRAVLSHFHHLEDAEGYVPVCLPSLPDSELPDSEVVASTVFRLADHLKVSSG